MVRGIRGATTAVGNTEPAIIEATTELLGRMMLENRLDQGDIAAIFFSTTPDLDAAFPAKAARAIGLTETALFGACELNPPGSIPWCIRVLILWNTNQPQSAIHHVYMRGATALRPEWGR